MTRYAMTQKAHNGPISSHPGRLLGYARVSTTSQNLDVQLRALTEVGVPAELVFTDKISGTQAERPGLVALMAEAREGDTLVLYSLDRLGRSLVHMVTTIDELIRRGVALRSLTDTIDTTTPAGCSATPECLLPLRTSMCSCARSPRPECRRS